MVPCPHHPGPPREPDSREALAQRVVDASNDTESSPLVTPVIEPLIRVRAVGYVTVEGSVIVGHYAEGHLRSYFLLSLN
jgi:hypothetical protein